MSFSGHVSSMISSLKNNRAGLKSGQSKKHFDKDAIVKSSGSSKINSKKLSLEEYAQIHDDIHESAKKDKSKELVAFVVVLVITVTIVLYFFMF